MKKLIIILTSSILITGCINTSKDENSKGISDKKEFISQRHLHENKMSDFKFKNEQEWDSLNNISLEQVLYKKGKVHPDIRTFGWHIYSNGSSWKNYNFPMLWGLSYFSYAIQPETGNYKSIHQWKTTALIDSAKVNGCKVFLSVSNFGSDNNSIFLKNSKAQKTLIDSLTNLLALRDANGINIDFEGVSKKNKKDFTKFILEVSKKLKQVNPKYMISLCLYAEDWNNIFDIKTIDSHVDFYTLMGYDYYGGFSKTTGPVSPLKKSMKFGNGIEESVNAYENKGVHLNKLIVGLPYYGAEWYTKNSEMGAIVTRFKSHPTYKSIREYYIDSLNIPLHFDSKSSSSYIVIKDSVKDYRQLFFEDVKSLSIKYDWIKKNKISGVGIWALGYDNGYPELWDLLTEKFSKKQNTTLYNNK
ncbi:glycosyl hydrolase family 18 protein [Lutibacter citreus]|uniref:glycosyl hydrolase family 18 protein n=1 Tax=Lutibacter citreus TaxID=2138210 RepID=UPI000DBE0A6D|nr:glycosyl hydrolase family 18 protein [Lutibacter citreus]